MSRVKDPEVSVLLELYGALLTEKQLNILSLYYNEDYSLREIAEIERTSRQAVLDLLKRSEGKLMEWDAKLRLLERFRKTESVLSQIEAASAAFSEPTRTEITAAVNELRAAWED